MKRIYFIILCCLFLGVSSGQSLIDQIEHAYSTLDSAAYIDDVILSYAESLDKLDEESYKTLLYLYSKNKDSIDVTQENSKVDSMYLADLHRNRILNSLEIKQFEKEVKSRTPLYVLNLMMKDEQTMQVDTGKLNFNLFYFGKNYKRGLYVYCDDGEYSWHDTYYYTFSKKIANNVPKVFKKIMRKHPKYLLLCSDLEGVNSVLYVLDNEIYVYKIVQMREYKLDYYMRHRSTIDIW